MFSNNPRRMFRIVSVLELSWEVNNRPSQRRDYHAISFRTQGNADFIYNGKTNHVTKNSITFVPQGMSYRLKHQQEHLYVVHFITDKELNTDFFSFVSHTPQIYQSLFKKMYDIWNNKKPGYYYATASIFCSILENIQKDISLPQSQQDADKLKMVIDYIHSNYTDSMLTIGQLADIFGTSETYFRKVFKNTFGLTPLKYINKLRTDNAIELLQSGYFSIGEIAEKSGFSDPKYFSRVIKREKNKTPSELNK